MHLLGPSNQVRRKIGAPDILYLSSFLAFLQGFHGLFQGRIRVRPVNLIEGDAIKPQSTQTSFESFHNPACTGVTRDCATLIPLHAKLCSNQNFSSILAQGLAKDFFGVAESVNVGGVKKINAKVIGFADGADRIAIVYLPPSMPPNRPASEPNTGNLKVSDSQSLIFHYYCQMARKVRKIILKSSQRDRFRTYSSRSLFLVGSTFSAKYLSGSSASARIAFKSLNFMDEKSVIPGGTSRIAISSGVYKRVYSSTSGLGPTRLISPFKTLKSCGNSSSLCARSHLPIRVIRGSVSAVDVPPTDSALATMVLNFIILKNLPCRPVLTPR